MTDTLDEVRTLLKSGDLPGAVRSLRPRAETLPLTELARAVRALADAAGFKDLAKAAKTAAKRPDDPQALYHLGYGCVEHGIAFLGIAPLRAALALVPDARPLLTELVSALEDEARHAEAAALLAARGDRLPAWPETYLLVHHTLLAGDLPGARAAAGRLPAPEEDTWSWAHARQRRMLARAELAATVGPLDSTDLRGWQFALTGTLLGTLSPYGYDAGMRGRYAFLGDSHETCRHGLARLAVALEATGHRPTTVSLLPGRSDRILGLAAATVLALPAVPYEPGRTDTLVVAYDLADADPGLGERADGQILYEHVTRWTSPPQVSADFSALQAQLVTEPWKDDARPEADIARDIAAADPTPDEGDGATPPDTDEAFRAYAAALAPGWLTGPRDRIGSPGPVPSSRFA
ncbi:hypothetical protein OHA37_04845 [Streptomyces sp. NBC_00335]|uniref:hypothetical protein n=1 Tax=unclassified Streptomyces TaxID=2593676 RepID=UPI00225A6089|nr:MULTISPECIES: hypothetical protein [unclassified Streptomyces]MCX5403209.1 hypothetical protein [Streptomyces sp. NBC_00086]